MMNDMLCVRSDRLTSITSTFFAGRLIRNSARAYCEQTPVRYYLTLGTQRGMGAASTASDVTGGILANLTAAPSSAPRSIPYAMPQHH